MGKILSFSLLIFIVGVYPYSAKAVEKLDFNGKISTSFKYQISLFLEETYKSDISLYDIAQTDLNNDGLSEYILKRKSCADKKNICIFSIIAEKQDGILLLSKITANNLLISKTSSNGVKDILAFKNEINDYNFDIYMWSPSQKMYIMNADK